MRGIGTAEHLAGGSLVETFRKTGTANGLEDANRAQSIYFTGIFRHVETDTNVTLCGQIVDFIRAHIVDDIDETFDDRNISVMQIEFDVFTVAVRIVINMIDTARVERTGTADDAVDFIPF